MQNSQKCSADLTFLLCELKNIYQNTDIQLIN